MSAFTKLPLILDGATGTELQKLGMPGGACSEKWALENPEAVKRVQSAYAAAGADAVYAPTFGVNRENFKKYGVTMSVEEACKVLVGLSREAVGDNCLVIGDMSPTGLMLEPFGEATPEQLEDIFSEQASAIVRAGVDIFGIETQMYLDEAKAAVRAVRAVTDMPLIVSFTCGPTGRSLWGEDLGDVMEELQKLGIDAFGINCCGEPETMVKVFSELTARAELPLVAKPNAGQPKMVDGVAVYDLTPEELAAYVPRFYECGVRLFGGCCGTHEGHIRAIKQALKNTLN